jgi:hypothetical protein
MSLVVRKEHFELQGALKQFTRSSDGGRPVVCSFCPECGTRIHHQATYFPDMFNVKPGTLDDTSWLKPMGQAWTDSKQPWIELELQGFPGQPPQMR